MRKFLSRVRDLLISPRETFVAIEHGGIRDGAVPILLQIICPALLFFIYYHLVNFGWLLSNMTAAMPEDQRRSITKVLTPAVMSASSFIVMLFTVPLVLAITALYFFLIGKLANIPQSYSRWLVFVSWASMPVILLLPIGLLVIIGSDGRVLPAELNPLALGTLLGLDPNNPWTGLANAISLLLLWSLFLTGVGLRVWTNMTVARVSLITALPYVVIFGTWAAIVFLVSAG